MNMEDFFAQLPTGKEDKPLLFEMGPLTYDFHDIDGLYYMLDRDLSGCLMLMWAKQMNPQIAGRVTLDGKDMKGILKQLPEMGSMWTLGVPLRGIITEYDRDYTLHVEGYTDTDGNEMNPQNFTVRSPEKVLPDPKYAAHEQTALQAAREGIVLMKNENQVLPVSKATCFNLFGKGVHEFRISAVGAGKINPRYSISFTEAVREHPSCSLNEELTAFFGSDTDRIPPADMMERAKAVSDTAFVFLTRAAGENQDASTARGEFYVDEEEDALIAAVTEAFTHTVVILNVGYPIDVRFADRYKVDGVIWLGFAGMLAGPALLDILTGEENPSGKLPDTWALDYTDIPSSRNFYDAADGKRLRANDDIYIDTVYEEGIYVGYRYFSTFGKAAAYPFGYGLSYTDFDIAAGQPQFDGDRMKLSVTVKNTGNRPGKEVIQIYVGKPEGTMEMPERELAAFEKTGLLAPGETQPFEIEVPLSVLASFSEEKCAWVCPAGEWKVYTGNSSLAGCCGSFRIAEEIVVNTVKHRVKSDRPLLLLSRQDPDHTWPKGEESGIAEGKTTFLPYAKREKFPVPGTETNTPGANDQNPCSETEKQQILTFEDVKKDLSLAEAYTAQLSAEELARLSICASAGWGMEGVGEAGSVYRPEGRDLPYFPVSDGNSGVNLNVKNIGMPSGATICASFSKELSAKIGQVIGEEAKTLGIPLILAPGFNIHRNPLNGRQPEYFSEDPYLSGMMAGHYARGLESTGVAGCYKHFLGNNCESSRKRNDSIIPERALREIYFRNFAYAFSVHQAASVMTAYNAVNGCPTAADEELLQGLLREELGFRGFIMTDWTTYDTVDVTAMVQAGNCWITPGSNDDTYTTPILDGIRKGAVDTGRLRENIASLLRVMAAFLPKKGFRSPGHRTV